jgi:hypothetical protein
MVLAILGILNACALVLCGVYSQIGLRSSLFCTVLNCEVFKASLLSIVVVFIYLFSSYHPWILSVLRCIP